MHPIVPVGIAIPSGSVVVAVMGVLLRETRTTIRIIATIRVMVKMMVEVLKVMIVVNIQNMEPDSLSR